MATKNEKGKGRASPGPDPDAGSSTSVGAATSFTEGNSAPSSLKNGHPLDAIKQALQNKFGTSTLPYLGNLRWIPTNDKSAPEKLQIGTYDGQDVFALFDATAGLNWQLHIVQAYGVKKHREITKAKWDSIDLIAPYTYLEQQILNKRAAQFVRTFIKACFALRGHSAGHKVSVNLETAVRCAATRSVNTPHSQPRDDSTETSQASEDNAPEIFETGTHATGFTAVNKRTREPNSGSFGMFSTKASSSTIQPKAIARRETWSSKLINQRSESGGSNVLNR
jgi:hypothetical protein